jgi:hypothetical protein
MKGATGRCRSYFVALFIISARNVMSSEHDSSSHCTSSSSGIGAHSSESMTMDSNFLKSLIIAIGITAVAFFIAFEVEDCCRRKMKKVEGITSSTFARGKNFEPDSNEVLPPKGNSCSNIFNALESDHLFGLFVIGGPRSCGKTTLLSKAVRLFQEKYYRPYEWLIRYFSPRRPIFYITGFTEDILSRIAGGIPRNTCFSNSLVQGTIIIIDQRYDSEILLSLEKIRILCQLSSQSKSQKAFKVIIIVSCPHIMEQILHGVVYAFSLVKTASLRWTKKDMEAFINLKYPQLTDQESVSNIAEEFKIGGCIGELAAFLNRLKERKITVVCAKRLKTLHCHKANLFNENQWKLFSKCDQKYLFDM